MPLVRIKSIERNDYDYVAVGCVFQREFHFRTFAIRRSQPIDLDHAVLGTNYWQVRRPTYTDQGQYHEKGKRNAGMIHELDYPTGVKCCYQALALRTRIGGQKMPIAGTPASGSVAQDKGLER